MSNRCVPPLLWRSSAGMSVVTPSLTRTTVDRITAYPGLIPCLRRLVPRYFERKPIFALFAFEFRGKSASDKPLRLRCVRGFRNMPIGLPVLFRAFDLIDVAPVKSSDTVIFGHRNAFDNGAEKCDLEAVNFVEHTLSLLEKAVQSKSLLSYKLMAFLTRMMFV